MGGVIMRGIRGAITVEQDEKADIWQAAAEMVTAMLQENGIAPEDIGAAIFSQTEDLVSAFPSTRASLPSKAAYRCASARCCLLIPTVHKGTSIISISAARRNCGLTLQNERQRKKEGCARG